MKNFFLVLVSLQYYVVYKFVYVHECFYSQFLEMLSKLEMLMCGIRQCVCIIIIIPSALVNPLAVYAQINNQTCQGLENLAQGNANLFVLGMCSRNTECTQVTCFNSSVPDLRALVSTITILPCNLPAPAINILSRGAGQAVLGNYTSSTSESNRPLTVMSEGGSTDIATLDWNVEYDATSLTIQVGRN